MFFPSTYPSSLRRCRNASVRSEIAEGEVALRYPIRGTLAGCCASAGRTVGGRTVSSRQTTILLTISFAPFVYCLLLTARCHLMTRSALASTLGGIVRPICFAALRLITSSNFVGCSTGRSAGFLPFKILSTCLAVRRYKSTTLTP